MTDLHLIPELKNRTLRRLLKRCISPQNENVPAIRMKLRGGHVTRASREMGQGYKSRLLNVRLWDCGPAALTLLRDINSFTWIQL